MDKVICAICNTETTEHGDGMKVPKTTCLLCYTRRMELNKIDREMKRLKNKEIR